MADQDDPRTSHRPQAAQPDDLIAGRFRPIRELGRGGFGETILAEEVALDRKVLLKLSLGPSAPGAPEAFAREAQASARLHHPRIVATHATGTLDDGRQYLVQEWVEGQTLEDVLRAGPLPVDAALDVAAGIAEALAAAHAVNVIHRDLKPSNVLVPHGSHGPDLGSAKLTDFGVFGELQGLSGLTQTGQIFGTPTYMAPEQLAGERQSPATDLYGLGTLLFEMIFGRPPFTGGNVMEIVLSITRKPVELPDTPQIPAAVRTLLLRCLAKNPDERYQSADQVLEAIDGLRRDEESTVLQAGPPEPVAASPGMPGGGMGGTGGTVSEPPKDSWTAATRVPSRPSLRRPSRASAARAVVAGRRFARLHWVWLAGILVVAGFAVAGWFALRRTGGVSVGPLVTGIAMGLGLALGGLLLAYLLRKRLRKLKTRFVDQASAVLVGARGRDALTLSLAVEVDELLARAKDLDERFLSKSLAIMVREFEAATDAFDRRGALMDAVDLLERLMRRISPWYVRHEKLLAAAVSLIGILSGVAKVVDTIMSAGAGP